MTCTAEVAGKLAVTEALGAVSKERDGIPRWQRSLPSCPAPAPSSRLSQSRTRWVAHHRKNPAQKPLCTRFNKLEQTLGSSVPCPAQLVKKLVLGRF